LLRSTEVKLLFSDLSLYISFLHYPLEGRVPGGGGPWVLIRGGGTVPFDTTHLRGGPLEREELGS
jgi:hypothetical protein